MTMPVDSPKRAILLLNLGGPEKLSDVRAFLYRLFSDPEVIRIPFAPLRKFVAWMISQTRENKSQALYRKIGGGSPIRRLTDLQAAGLKTALATQGKDTEVKTAFTCSVPLVEDEVRMLAEAGVRQFLSFPLYPQYSYTTTKSSLDRVQKAVKKYASGASVTEIRSWQAHPLFLKAHAELIEQEFKKFHVTSQNDVHLVFSAHSIPEKLVTDEGDPYKDHMEETVQGILQIVKWTGPWTLAWQSKLGPVKWLAPATIDVIRSLGRKGVKNILVVPVAFVTDHIETLEEIDFQIAEAAKDVGVEEFHRTPGLNNHPTFIQALTDLALSKKDFWTNGRP